MTESTHIRDLIIRLARLDAASAWEGDLNPSQRAVLGYLSRANRFSRSPSHVASYLGSTRGTVSQTFKSLVQKGYVSEFRSHLDRRTISFDLTDKGRDALIGQSDLEEALSSLSQTEAASLRTLLEESLLTLITKSGGRGFGICRDCRHHRQTGQGRTCALLSVPLASEEADQICHEQETA